jgi:hypothetical protein
MGANLPQEATMTKRIILVVTFLATFCVAGIAVTDTAEARRGWRGPYAGAYFGPPGFYRYAPPLRAYNRYSVPRRYYTPYYAPYRAYGYPAYSYYYGPRGRVALRIGF